MVGLSSPGKTDNESPVLKAYTLCMSSILTAIIEILYEVYAIGRGDGGKNARKTRRAALAFCVRSCQGN